MKYMIHRIDRVDSTNKYAFTNCRRMEAEEGDVFIASEQFDGKGYHTNRWLSEPGKNLTFSLVLQPDFITPAQQFVITQFISLAIVDLLKGLILHENIRIKWPNDIYINDMKVCGILVQNTIIRDAFEYVIIGIGLNVNQMLFPTELPNPTSIIQFLKHEVVLDDLLNDLLNCINERYKQLMMLNDAKALQKEYLDHLYHYDKSCVFKDKNETFKGRITGVGEFGELLIHDESGVTKKYQFKEVEFVK